LRVLTYLSDILVDEARYPEAEAIARESIDRQRRKSGPDSPDTLRAQTDLGLILLNQGRFSEAEQVYRDTLAADRRVFGPENRVTLNTMGGLAEVLNRENRGVEAENLQRQTVDTQSRVLGPENRETLISMTLLANTLDAEGKTKEAEQLERRTLITDRRVLGPANQRTLVSLGHEGIYLAHLRRYAEAQKLFREGIDAATQAKQPGELANVWYNFACAAASVGRKNEALQYLGQAIDLGFTSAPWIDADGDLESLHGDPRYKELLAKARQASDQK
jgi:tetratricopeptide (TPR) repeat protein